MAKERRLDAIDGFEPFQKLADLVAGYRFDKAGEQDAQNGVNSKSQQALLARLRARLLAAIEEPCTATERLGKAGRVVLEIQSYFSVKDRPKLDGLDEAAWECAKLVRLAWPNY